MNTVNASSTRLQSKELLFEEERACLFMRDKLKSDFIARTQLANARQIGGDNMRDFGISTGGRMLDE